MERSVKQKVMRRPGSLVSLAIALSMFLPHQAIADQGDPTMGGCFVFPGEYTPTTITLGYGLDPEKCGWGMQGLHFEGTITRVRDESVPDDESTASRSIDCEPGEACVLLLTIPHPNPEFANYEALIRWSSPSGGYGIWSISSSGCQSAGPVTWWHQGIGVWRDGEETWVYRPEDLMPVLEEVPWSSIPGFGS